MNTKVFIRADAEVERTHMVEIANNMMKTPNFWLFIVGTIFFWAMTRYIPELLNNSYKERFRVHATSVLHRHRHRKIRRSSDINTDNKPKEQVGENFKQPISNDLSCTKYPSSNSRSTYEHSTPAFVPLSASIQSAPPSPPHFTTPSRIVPTNYGSEIKLKLMTREDKVLRFSSIREQYMKYRPTISSRLNPIRRCELGLRSSVGVLSPRYLSDVKMDTGYNEDQMKKIICAAGRRNERMNRRDNK